MRAIRYFLVLSFLASPALLNAQYITDQFSPSAAAYTDSSNVAGNFGLDSLLYAYSGSGSTNSIKRSFVKFDLSSIPVNALIHTATLKLYVESEIDAMDNSFYLSRIDDNWNEGSISWVNQPPIVGANQLTIGSVGISAGSYVNIDVTDHVEHMTNYENLNQGWSIQLQNETGSNDFGVVFGSNNAVLNKQPRLEIGYTLPPEIDIQVTHCTTGNNDGAIDATLSGGGVPYHATIYKVDPDTTQAGNASLSGVYAHGWSHLNDTLVDYSGLGPGVYFLRIMDSLYQQTVNPMKLNYEFYKYFLIGREGEVTESMLIPNARYYESIGIQQQRRDTIPSITNGANTNFTASNPHFLGVSSTRYPALNTTEVQYDFASLIKYNVQFDNAVNFENVELTMRGWTSFYRSHTSSNATNYSLVTSPWEEETVTWNTRPAIDSTFKSYKPTTPTIGYHPNALSWDTLDLTPFFNYWQLHPQSNYGIELALENYKEPAFASRAYKGPGGNQHYVKISFSVPLTANTKYWVGTNNGDWNDPMNWSDVSGGMGGVGVPNASSIVVFDSNGNVNCYHSENVEVASVIMYSGYTANVDFGDYELISNELLIQNE